MNTHLLHLRYNVRAIHEGIAVCARELVTISERFHDCFWVSLVVRQCKRGAVLVLVG